MPAVPSAERPKNRDVENEDMKPERQGQPPRSAAEPSGSEGSARNSKTKTDPASGESQD